MKRLFTLLMLFPVIAIAQKVEFDKDTDTVFLAKGKSATYGFKIKCVGCTDKVKFTVEKHESSTFPADFVSVQEKKQSYEFEANPTKNRFYFVHVTAGDSADYSKRITVKLTHGEISRYTDLYVLPYTEAKKKTADSTRYRMLVGTNFDFIDGIKAKDLYYHLQFFVPDAFVLGKKKRSRFGFVGGIQQNRQVSQLDTSVTHYVKGKGFYADSFRLASYTRVGTDSFRVVRADEVTLQRTTETNILQLYIQPTFKLAALGGNETNVYAIAHADIQFRRVRNEEKFGFKTRDTVTLYRSSFSKYTAVSEKTATSEIKYHFNYGAGVMLHHQNEYVDMYLKGLLGVSHMEEDVRKLFYATEVGVRVVNFNLMLGAEYRGLFKEHDPQYLNVYLSKAFSLSKLADFLLK